MKKIVMLRQTIVNGEVARVKEVLEVSDMDARYLIGRKKATMHQESEHEDPGEGGCPKPAARKNRK